MKKYSVVMGLCFALTGCLASGPEKPLEDMAKALENRDATAFLSHMDMKRYATVDLHNTTQGNSALSALNDVSKMLGLGAVDNLLGSVVDMEKSLMEDFTRSVSTGELINQCTRSQKPQCPWVPESLRAAKVKEISEKSAVAQVTTPAGMTSWLALAKEGDVWKVVGRAVLEKDATGAAAAPTPVVKDNQNKVQEKPQSNEQGTEEKSPPPPVTKL